MRTKELLKLTEADITKGAFLEVGYSPRLKDKDLRKITVVNRRDWLVRVYTGIKDFDQTFYCYPETKIYLRRKIE